MQHRHAIGECANRIWATIIGSAKGGADNQRRYDRPAGLGRTRRCVHANGSRRTHAIDRQEIANRAAGMVGGGRRGYPRFHVIDGARYLIRYAPASVTSGGGDKDAGIGGRQERERCRLVPGISAATDRIVQCVNDAVLNGLID